MAKGQVRKAHNKNPNERYPMPKYTVTWEIELTPDSPHEAAETASYIQHTGPTPTVFTVNGQQIDLEADSADSEH
jgi:hypothetical protein